MKIYFIESQTLDTEMEKFLLNKLLLLAKEAGYTHIQDLWAPGASDSYTINEAIDKFLPAIVNSNGSIDELI